MSIRLRLSLLYTFILLITLLAFGLGTYVILSRNLQAEVDRTINDTAQEIKDNIWASRGDGPIVVTIRGMDAIQASGVFVQIWDASTHRLLASSSNVANLAQPLDPKSMPATGQVTSEVGSGRQHLRVVTVPLRRESSTVVCCYLQVGAWLKTVDDVQHGLAFILGVSFILATVASFLAGWIIAGRTLKPIDEMTRTALQISRADDLGRRVTYSGPPDEIGRLAGAFNEMLERLDRLFRSQQRFLADISHELRTPLTTIRGNIDLLRWEGRADLDSLDAMQSEAERMTRLVGDLLLLAQADAGVLPIAKRPVELDTLLLEVFRQTRLLSTEIHIHLGEEDQATVLGDADRLKQLLLNLVDNAVKYTPQGGDVTLSLRHEDGWAKLTVIDTGPGIPPEDMPHVFDRFYRVDKARSRAKGGTGLGLSIAQWIAQAHGGRISVQSQLGRGTVFQVELPVLTHDHREHESKESDQPSTVTGPLVLRS